jgi:hypothetical protein
MDRQPERIYFTVEEARQLVPTLRPMLIEMREDKAKLHAEMTELSKLTPAMRANGHAPAARGHESEILRLAGALRDKLIQVNDLGIEVKDVDSGLVDFPSLREGREVYLCWRVDEETVSYWHEIEAGFIGRQRLDE